MRKNYNIMLTIQQIKENPQYVIDRLKVKGFDGKEKIEKILALDERRRTLQLQSDTIAAGLNRQAAEIGKLMKAGEREAAEAAKAEVAKAKEDMKKYASELDAVEKEMTDIRLTIPNIPCEAVPRARRPRTMWWRKRAA